MRTLLHSVRDVKIFPLWYTEVDGFSFNNNCYFTINLKLQWDDTLKVSFTPEAACNILWSYTSASSTKNYSLYASTTAWSKYLRYNWWTYNSYITADTKYTVEITPTWSKRSNSSLDETRTQKTFIADTDMYIGTTSPSATSSKMVWTIWGRIKVVERAELAPCKRNSDDVLWYYDLINNVFYTPTTWTPTAVTS